MGLTSLNEILELVFFKFRGRKSFDFNGIYLDSKL